MLEISDLAILWDMDGTILDTFDLHYETWKEALSSYSTPFNRDLFRHHFGRNNRQVLPLYMGFQPDEDTYNSIANHKEELFRQQLASKTHLFPGVKNWFAFFKQHGAKQAIASSANIENVDKVVDAFQIRPFFDALIAGDDMPSKPAPDIFLHAAEILEVPPQQCVVFEDSQYGVSAAKAAGMVSVGIAGTAEFKPGDADFIIYNYMQDPAPFADKILHLIETRVLMQR